MREIPEDRRVGFQDVPPRRGERWRPLWVKALALTVSLLASLFLAEALVRLIAPQPQSWLDIYRKHPVLPFYAHQPNVQRSLDTGETHWTLRTDEDGFRVGEKVSAASVPAILILGDSFTFALGVDYQQSFAGRLEEAFAGRYRVINTGVSGYGPMQYHAVLDYLLGDRGLRPKAVVVATYLGNDFHDCVWEKNIPVINGILGNEASMRSFLKRSSHLYRLAARGVHKLFSMGAEELDPITAELSTADRWQAEPLRTGLSIYREQFATMAQQCQKLGIPLVVCILPIKEAIRAAAGVGPAVDAEGHDFRLVGEKANKALEGLPLVLCDATADLSKADPDKVFFHFDNHLTSLGHHVVADLIQKKLSVAITAINRP